MNNKKYTDEEIRTAIIMKYGSVEEYARKNDMAKANIYQKISRQSSKFLKELNDNGIVFNKELAVTKTTNCEKRIAELEKEVLELKAKLYDLTKDKI